MLQKIKYNKAAIRFYQNILKNIIFYTVFIQSEIANYTYIFQV